MIVYPRPNNISSNMEYFTTILLSFIFSLFSLAISKFSHIVTPSCRSDTKVCEFDFEVSYMETMVYFDQERKKAAPVVYRNGTFYRRNSYNCDTMTPMTEEGMFYT